MSTTPKTDGDASASARAKKKAGRSMELERVKGLQVEEYACSNLSAKQATMPISPSGKTFTAFGHCWFPYTLTIFRCACNVVVTKNFFLHGVLDYDVRLMDGFYEPVSSLLTG